MTEKRFKPKEGGNKETRKRVKAKEEEEDKSTLPINFFFLSLSSLMLCAKKGRETFQKMSLFPLLFPFRTNKVEKIFSLL